MNSADPLGGRFDGRIGIIGIGALGRPISENLVASGFSVGVYDIDSTKTADLSHLDIRVYDTLSGIAANSNLIILLVTDGTTAKEVVLGGSNNSQGGLRSFLESGSIVIDMGSSSPRDTRDIAQALSGANIHFLDAPVSRGVKGARERSLTIMAGGSPEIFNLVLPVLEHLGNDIFHVGATGVAQSLKALNNYLSAAGLLAACEALVAAENLGIDRELFLRVINSSSGMNFATKNKLPQYIFTGKFNSGMTTGLMAKDLRSTREVFDAMKLSAPFADFCQRQWAELEHILGALSDHTNVYRHCAGENHTTTDNLQEVSQ